MSANYSPLFRYLLGHIGRSFFVSLAGLYCLMASSPGYASPPGKFKERVENDFMLLVPTEVAEDVWAFMQSEFGHGVDVEGIHLDTKIEIDKFNDQYFDTNTRKLTDAGIGFRHRSRLFGSGATKELIQIKLTPFGEHAAREELKFELDAAPEHSSAALLSALSQRGTMRELFSRVKGKDKDRFEQDLKRLGLSRTSLRPFIHVNQERRRVYFSEGPKRIITVTLDFMDAHYFWAHHKFVSIEVEIGENTFTGASEENRERYFAIQEALARILTNRFPSLSRDTNPKVVLLYRAMQEDSWLSRMVVRNSFDSLFYFLAVFGFIVVYAWAINRYRKKVNQSVIS